MVTSRPAHLEPSKLGTKEYWDSLYTNELSNHAADPSDIGTVWFDDSDAEAKIIDYLATLADDADNDEDDDDEDGSGGQIPSALAGTLSRQNTSFLDLGCGNGSLLFALRDEGWAGPALGVDYSSQSVALAKQVAASRHDSSSSSSPSSPSTPSTPCPSPQFREWDIIAGPYTTVLDATLLTNPTSSTTAAATPPPPPSAFDVVLDKGTFDAISLSDQTDTHGRRLCDAYRARVLPLVRDGGLFLVTSCNWTEDELRGWFDGVGGGEGGGEDAGEGESQTGRFRVAGRVDYRTFSFGGVKGQTISTLCFKKES